MKLYKLILLLIIFLALFLRFYGITERGIFAYDEGYYHELVKTWNAVFKYSFLKIFNNYNLPFKEYILTEGGQIRTAAKPGYALLGLFFSLAFGLYDYTLPALSALCGVFTVFLVYLIGKKLFDLRIGLIAALVLAVSWLHIEYSRSAYPHVASTSFLYLAIFGYFSSREKKGNFLFCLSGLLLGIAFTIHYNLFWAAGLLSLLVLFKEGRKRFILFTLMAISPLLFWEILTRIVKLIIFSYPQWQDIGFTYKSYFEELLGQVKGGSVPLFDRYDPLFFVKLLLNKEGLIGSFFLLVSLFGFFLFRKKSVPGVIIPVLFFLTPFILWSLCPHGAGTKSFVAAMPAFSLLVAIGLVIFSQWLSNLIPKFSSKLAVTVLSLLLIISGIVHAREPLNYRSGFKEAIEFMRLNGSVKHLSSNPLVSRVYVGRKNAIDTYFSFRTPQDPRGKKVIDLSKVKSVFFDKNYKYLLLDQERYFHPNQLVSLAEEIRPVFVTSHSTRVGIVDASDWMRERLLSEPEVLEVYELKDIVDKIK